MGKGDGRRKPNPLYQLEWQKGQIDMGSFGCKRGNHYYFEGLKCQYCGKLSKAGESVQQGMEDVKAGRVIKEADIRHEPRDTDLPTGK